MKHSIQQYHQDNFEIIELKSAAASAKIAVNIGNTLFSLKQKDAELLYFPFSLKEYKTNAKLAGNPFMHPWANRLEDEYIRVGGKKHEFPKEQKQLLYRDGNNLPLHGLLLKSDKWKTIEMHEDENSCCHIAELVFDDENFLSIFPFKHTVQIKHELRDNELKIETTVLNQDEKEMPVSFGFHPYFFRNSKDAQLTIPSFYAIDIDEKMIPNNGLTSKNQKWNFIDDTISLDNVSFDDGFSSLKYNNDEQAVFSLDDIKLKFDRNYSHAQIYSPQNPDKPYVCIEPMTAVTNALNTGSCKMIKKYDNYKSSFYITR